MEIKNRLQHRLFFIVLCAIIIVMVAACDKDIVETNSDTVESNALIESTEESTVISTTEESTSELEIINEYLTPLVDFSWEREYDVEFIMLHFCSNVVANLQNPYDIQQVRQIFIEYEVSIHYIIDRDGTVYCYIPENRAAWHAGKGTWNNDDKYTNDMNRYSIGIEMLAIGSQGDMAQYLTEEQYSQLDDSLIGYTEAQYQSLDSLLDIICENNNIPRDKEHIIGHEEYSPLKTDPGELFDWNRIIK